MCSRGPFESRHNFWLSNLQNRTTANLERRKKEEDDKETSLHPDINRVDRVHWYFKDNARSHHTAPYDLIHDKYSPQAVLRRGQAFYIGIRFKDRNFDIKKDRVVLNFEFGPNPSIAKGTLGVTQVKNNNFTRTKDDWDVRIDTGSKEKDLIVQVFAPASAPVGRWCLKVKTGLQDYHMDKSTCEYTVDSEAYILFNPFCKDDMVYLENEKEREEYVMNDKGKVCVAANRDYWGSPWAFGQFEDVVLPVAVYILDNCQITDTERANPVQVVRAISSMVNSNEGEGILEAKWPQHGTIESYTGGVSPMKWVSSVSIIEKYIENGYRPVKYGQCWIFSALVTTICRTLGIPCRPVTNVVSAQDTNLSLTVDKLFAKDGEELKYNPSLHDSVWNFHAWNDVWMARTDLPKGYGGWQAIDATPQITDGKWQCGPAPLEAIRRGDIGLSYDGAFIFAEVNANIIHWQEDESSPEGWKGAKTKKYHIGRKILTKKPGVDDELGIADLEDIINQYKNKEKSKDEHLGIHNAIRGIRRAPHYDCYKSDCKEDVTFNLQEMDHIKIGDDYVVKVVVSNKADKARNIRVALSTKSVYYTGVSYQTIKKLQNNFVLQPKQSKDVTLVVKYSEYWSKLVEGCMVKINVMGHVQETDQMFADEDDFMMEKAFLQIQVSKELKRDELCVADLSFKNPLDVPLTDCEVTITGPGLMRDKHIKDLKPVPAKGTFNCQIKFKPRIHGQQRKLIALFNARELFDILGTKSVTVKK